MPPEHPSDGAGRNAGHGGDGAVIADLLTRAWRGDGGTMALDAAIADRIVPVLMSTNAGPMLYPRLGRDGDSPHATDLRDVWRMAQLNTEIQTHAIAEISALLADAGVQHALLKGWSAARFYADPALRPFGDIDLLVHPDQRAAALDVLLPLAPAGTRAGMFRPGQDHVFTLNWHYPAALSKVDLHHALVRFHLPDSVAVLARAEPVSLAGQMVPVLSAADLFQVLCLHALINGCWRPIWLTDIAAFVEAHPPALFRGVAENSPPLICHWMGICIGLARDLLGLETDALPPVLGQQAVPRWLVSRVLANWQLHFSDFHNKTDIGYLRGHHPWQLPVELVKRWPDPVRAVFERGRQFPPHIPVVHQALFYLAQIRRGLTATE